MSSESERKHATNAATYFPIKITPPQPSLGDVCINNNDTYRQADRTRAISLLMVLSSAVRPANGAAGRVT